MITAFIYTFHFLIVLWFVGVGLLVLFGLFLFALVLWEWRRDSRKSGRAF